MDSSLELWFVEFRRKLDVRMERRWAALEQRGAAVESRISGLKEPGTTELVVADNWGGLFDEIPSDEPVSAPDTASSDSAPDTVSSDSDALPFVPALDAAFVPTPQFHEVAPVVEKRQVAPREAASSGFLVARGEQGRRATVVHAEGLGASARVYIASAVSSIDFAAPLRVSFLEFIRLPVSPSSPAPAAAYYSDDASTDDPRLSLMYPLRQTDLDCLYELGARRKLKQVVCRIVFVPVELALHSPDSTGDMELHRATGMYNPRLMALRADLNASRGGAEPVFVGVGFAPDDSDPLPCVRLTLLFGHVECALRATPLGGYDSSLDDGPATIFVHFDAPLDQAVGRVGHTVAGAAALRADAVGAAGGGSLACIAAVGSSCSTNCPADGLYFLDGTCYNTSKYSERCAALSDIRVDGNHSRFYVSLRGLQSVPPLLRVHLSDERACAASVLDDPTTTARHHQDVLQAAQHAVKLTADSIELAHCRAVLLFDAVPDVHLVADLDVLRGHVPPPVRHVACFPDEVTFVHMCTAPACVVTSVQQPQRHVESAFVNLSVTLDVSASLHAHLVRGRVLKTVLPGVLLSSAEGKMDSMDLFRYKAPVSILLLVPASLVMERIAVGLAADVAQEDPSFLNVPSGSLWEVNVLHWSDGDQGLALLQADPLLFICSSSAEVDATVSPLAPTRAGPASRKDNSSCVSNILACFVPTIFHASANPVLFCLEVALHRYAHSVLDAFGILLLALVTDQLVVLSLGTTNIWAPGTQVVPFCCRWCHTAAGWFVVLLQVTACCGLEWLPRGSFWKLTTGMAVCYIEYMAQEVDASSPTGTWKITAAA